MSTGYSETVRLRRLPNRGLLRKRVYEVEIPAARSPGEIERQKTSTPVVLIDKYLGVGDAWALVHAADKAWNGHTGKWVKLFNEE